MSVTLNLVGDVFGRPVVVAARKLWRTIRERRGQSGDSNTGTTEQYVSIRKPTLRPAQPQKKSKSRPRKGYLGCMLRRSGGRFIDGERSRSCLGWAQFHLPTREGQWDSEMRNVKSPMIGVRSDISEEKRRNRLVCKWPTEVGSRSIPRVRHSGSGWASRSGGKEEAGQTQLTAYWRAREKKHSSLRFHWILLMDLQRQDMPGDL